jgi:hydrogenase maturation protease
MVPRSDTPRDEPWVVGLGTTFGDDRVGWDVVARLQKASPPGTRLVATSDPLAVADVPVACRLLVVIDACRGAGPPGSVRRFEWPDRRFAGDARVSSHGVGLVTALDLAAALGRLPPRVVMFAVEGETAGPEEGLSRSVTAALPGIVEQVTAELSPGADGGRG